MRRFPDQSHLKKMIPVVNAIEIKEIKDILGGQPLAIIFDGTTRICEAFATLCRFVDEDLNPQHKLVTISLINDQLDGLTTAREIIKIIMQ